MSNLTKIWKELFWVLLEEEISNFGVFQTPRPTAVGHNGECGGNAAAARNYLGLRQRLGSPHRWLICRTRVSYVFRAKKKSKNWHVGNVGKWNVFMHLKNTFLGPCDWSLMQKKKIVYITYIKHILKKIKLVPTCYTRAYYPEREKCNAKQEQNYDISCKSQEWRVQNPDEAKKKKKICLRFPWKQYQYWWKRTPVSRQPNIFHNLSDWYVERCDEGTAVNVQMEQRGRGNNTLVHCEIDAWTETKHSSDGTTC